MAERSMVRNAADPEQVQYATRKTKDRAKYRAQLVREQLSTPRGREFVWMELDRCGINDLIDGDASSIYQFLGKRAVGIELYVEVQKMPDLFLLMQKEALERVTRAEREQDSAQTPPITEARTP